jgi:hypothetical protein
MIYPSKKDWWMTLMLLAISLIQFGIGSVILYALAVHAAPLPAFLAGLVPLLAGGLVLWVYLSTGYTIRPPELVVRSGPFWRTIALDAIVEVQPRKKYVLELGWNFALSHDRLFIKYRKPNGRVALLGLVVSPEDQEGFLEELAREVPSLKNENGKDERP